MTSAARPDQDVAADQVAPRNDTPGAAAHRSRLISFLGRHRTDLAVCLFFGLFSGWLTAGLWPDPGTRILALNPEDQVLYEWFLAADARILHGDFSLLSDRLNAPDGVNLMTNTTVIALGALLAPVTVLAGAPVTFALIVTGNLAGTAISWYLFYRRVPGVRPLAAGIGAGFCGFAPGMLSQSNSHLHMTAQWLVPLLVWWVVRMVRAARPAQDADGATWDRGRVLTSAIGLGVTVAIQVFLGEEVLFLTAVTLLIFIVVYGLVDLDLTRRVLPGFLSGMLLATGVGLLLLGYPLWFQFAGPQGVSDGLFSPHYFSADLASWWAISPLSLAGTAEASRLTTGPAEYNTFLGWPLLAVAVLAVCWLGRRPTAIACGLAAVVMTAFSLGPVVLLNGEPTGVPGPYSWLLGLPVVDGALPMRFALALIPLIATVLVLAVERALADDRRPVRFAVPAVVAAALLPLFPLPLPTDSRPPLPRFISTGHWRNCVAPGGVLVPVPLPTPQKPWAMRWATAADVSFGLPEGFFIGPYAADGKASMGTYPQPTSRLLAEVAETGVVPPIGAQQRQQARRDVAFWGASCVALAPDAPHAERLLSALEELFGPATRMIDVWVWRVGQDD